MTSGIWRDRLHVWTSDESDSVRPGRPIRNGLVAWLGTVVSAFLSAIVCGVLLLVNGAITYVVLESMGTPEGGRISGDGVMQFILYTAPIVMLIIEWVMLDIAIGLLRGSWSEKD